MSSARVFTLFPSPYVSKADEAHKALEEASSTLCGLADYCEENFVEGRMGTGGGSSLEETTEFAVKALRASLQRPDLGMHHSFLLC